MLGFAVLGASARSQTEWDSVSRIFSPSHPPWVSFFLHVSVLFNYFPFRHLQMEHRAGRRALTLGCLQDRIFYCVCVCVCVADYVVYLCLCDVSWIFFWFFPRGFPLTKKSKVFPLGFSLGGGGPLPPKYFLYGPQLLRYCG